MFYKSKFNLKSFTLTVSALILVIIALDRWLLVCFVPCVIMTKACVKQLIIGTYIIGLLWSIPMGLHQGVHTYFKISTVDKLVSGGTETNIMLHELNRISNTKQSELNGNISDNSLISSKKLSSTYFSTQFRQRFLSIQTDKINLNNHQQNRLSLDCYKSATQPINLNQLVITKDPKIVSHNKEPIFYQNNNDLQCTTGRKHVFSSVKRTNRTRLPNNRHIRSAITFILITVSFLISYLPSLLIANGFIWPVKWELTAGTTDEFTYIYNNNTINITNSLLFNEHLIDNLKSTVITLNNQRLVNLTNNILPIHKHNVTSKIIIKYHLRRLFHFLYFINSAANPLIYFFFNLKFRLQLKFFFNYLNTCFTNQNSI
ncbi:hypothetical protein MN116_006122 [Schistosoma mekongi]|uniref:G-protein coupled receptors family 1 profile domain-containing protein n=1 Tax=Schistosoma mekongi TaxID=38744 RepID=A0AAE1ZAM9_SCHME|nr:hypothetical protein MN116_006122 [Schistosoma mekongi]